MSSIVRSKEFSLVTGYIVGGGLMWVGNYLRYADASIKGVSMCYPITGCVVSSMGVVILIASAFETMTHYVK